MKPIDVFISYSSKDRDKVATLAEALKSAGLSVWWDQEIDAGTAWENILVDHLLQSKVIVVAWTKSAVDSSWVLPEAGYARMRDRLVSVTFEAVDIPSAFSSIQAADLSRWVGTQTDPNFMKLLEAIDNKQKRHNKNRRFESNLLKYGKRNTPILAHIKHCILYTFSFLLVIAVFSAFPILSKIRKSERFLAELRATYTTLDNIDEAYDFIQSALASSDNEWRSYYLEYQEIESRARDNGEITIADYERASYLLEEIWELNQSRYEFGMAAKSICGENIGTIEFAENTCSELSLNRVIYDDSCDLYFDKVDSVAAFRNRCADGTFSKVFGVE